ncbi:MAG: putative nicotinate-nucleotide pyrophosphorylase (carboxylating) [Lentisphaerae bacterium ADurb.BinA184]|nr:MAG: putative nicotinate-nucleotide pyrophosphorylase (carboxylating) [Lentisphaerae bacterium ADurb.BinA184]
MLTRTALQALARAALAEDIGSGDATTLAVVPEGLVVTAFINTREACVCAGLDLAEEIFRELDPACVFERLAKDGASCPARTNLARVRGPARAILSGERVALNFLQRLSGTATLTRRYVEAVGRHPARILDTRKTTPGLRALEKYAVRMGGGDNHRMGLYDRIMIKDNHRLLANLEGPGGLRRAVEASRRLYPALSVEVEADCLDDVAEAIEARADCILLDNMDDEQIRDAVRLVGGRALTEASGGMTLERIPAVAAAGVDFISVGALTHSARAIDIGLDLPPPNPAGRGALT